MTTELERQLANLKPGDHVCPIYQSRAEQWAAAVPFVTQGLARGERCLYVSDDRTAEELHQALAAGGVDVAQELERGALRLLTKQDSYHTAGEFDPRAMIDFLRRAEAQALAEGYGGLRVVGEMTWALGPEVGNDWLIEYEVLLNQFLPDSRTVIACQYNRSRFDPALIHDILRTHPVAVLGDLVCPNPFYEPPQMILGQMSPSEKVDWKIAQLQRARAAEQELQKSHALLRAVVEGIPDAVFVKDRQGRYRMINSAGARFLGKTVEEVLGKEDTDLFTPETARPIMEDDRRILATGETLTRERVATAGGVTRTYLATKGPYRDPEDNVVGIIGVAHDLTARKALQVERDRLLERLRLQIDRLPLAYILMDADGRVIDWNPAAERMFGYTKEEALGQVCLDLIVPPSARDLVQEVDRRIRAGDMHAHSVNENRTKDGRIITCEWLNTPLIDADGRFTGAIFLAQDVTDRVRAEAALRQQAERLQTLSRRLTAVQEEERRRIARELHDEIGQMLTGLRFVLEADPDLPAAAAGKKLADARSLTDALLTRVRDLSFGLRPAMLDHLGLLPALMHLFDRYTQQTGVRVDYRHEGLDRRFEPEIETAAYRIVQEALTNVARHAGVKEATVRLWVEPGVLGVQVQDHGAGFRPEAVSASGDHAGLTGVYERVTLLGGELLIESEPGAGTQLTALLPLRAGGGEDQA